MSNILRRVACKKTECGCVLSDLMLCCCYLAQGCEGLVICTSAVPQPQVLPTLLGAAGHWFQQLLRRNAGGSEDPFVPVAKWKGGQTPQQVRPAGRQGSLLFGVATGPVTNSMMLLWGHPPLPNICHFPAVTALYVASQQACASRWQHLHRSALPGTALVVTLPAALLGAG